MLQKYIHKFKKSQERKHHNFLDMPGYFEGQDAGNVGPNSYSQNVIVHRCVSLIASAASHVPWLVYKNGDRNINHPLIRLLKRPNAEKSGADFFTEIISSLLLFGNSYVLSPFPENQAPKAIYNLHAKATEIIFQDQKPVAYKYKTLSGADKIYPINQVTKMSGVLMLKNYHPMNQHYGLSSLEAAAKSINLHSKTMEWNKALLKNASKPSGALMFQDGNGYLTDEQFARLKEQFYDNFSGSSNSGKPLILEGGLKWQETNNAEKFEKFLDLKDSSARDIAIAFNVPPQLLGINGDNTYSNMQEARLALWEENIIPLLDRIADAFSNWFSHLYSEELHIDFDRDSISALTSKREDMWAKIAGADFMTLNEKRALVGLGAVERVGNE